MPLRVRLSIAFVAIVLVPLSVTAFLVRNAVRSNFDTRAAAQLSGATDGADSAYRSRQDQARIAASGAASPAMADAVVARQAPRVRELLAQLARRDKGGRADFYVVAESGSKPRILGSVVARQPTFLQGTPVPAVDTLIRDDQRGPAVLGRLLVANQAGTVVGTVWAGYWLDQTFLDRVTTSTDVELTLLSAGTPVATTSRSGPPAGLETEGDAEGFRHQRETLGADDSVQVVASVSLATAQESTGRTSQSIAVVIVVSLLMAGLFGWLLARVTTRPLAELGEAANSVASGRLDTRIDVRSRDEVGKLAVAFNTMTDELRTYIQALQDSRDELKRNLTRLGDTLSSTHDLKKMLAVILETAMVTIRAEAGALMLFSANRDELYLKVGRGLDGRLSSSSVRVQVGDGVAGRVAEAGEAVRGQVGVNKDQLRLAPSEPRADSVISVPLKSQGKVIGVLNLYDRVDADEFDDNDLATIRSFANQATVAIDNVLLHQEAQRLSITDGLTGLWNYRYFQMQFDKEIERASRFGRPLALLVLDLDRFKAVNDQYGHQRGDSVLIELATRVKGAIRDVDILARYGGEEFVLILPETDLEGAVQAAGKINELVRGRRFGAAGEQPLRITVSIGLAVYPEHGRSGASLLKSADSALYAAKEAGRDGYWVATPMPTMPDGEPQEFRAPRGDALDVSSPVAGLDDLAAVAEADLGPAPVGPEGVPDPAPAAAPEPDAADSAETVAGEPDDGPTVPVADPHEPYPVDADAVDAGAPAPDSGTAPAPVLVATRAPAAPRPAPATTGRASYPRRDAARRTRRPRGGASTRRQQG
jgi:two-component system, cell cycle response regulator